MKQTTKVYLFKRYINTIDIDDLDDRNDNELIYILTDKNVNNNNYNYNDNNNNNNDTITIIINE